MYQPKDTRYDKMTYNHSGNSGLKLPSVSLGLWHNFGKYDHIENMKQLCFTAFDEGITHFDLANNYGPEEGRAEINFGQILREEMKSCRDEMLISTKAGYYMWPGPYGDWGSRKYLISSIDQSLTRMGLDYVDIFYHHRPDPNTPLEETMMALDQIVKSGKALYAGISNYNKEQTIAAVHIMKELRCPLVINQVRYSMFDRWIEEDGLREWAAANRMGLIAFSPLAQGLLTDKYLGGIPQDSRIRKDNRFLTEERLTPEVLAKIGALNEIAAQRGQTLAQMALSWVLRDGAVTSVLIGASKPEQIKENSQVGAKAVFCPEEQTRIEQILSK